MPKGGACEHYNCDGGECKMLTDEELQPTERDYRDARELLQKGWYSTSNKHRTIARFTEPVPKIEAMVSPEVLATNHGQRLKRMWDQMYHAHDLRTSINGVQHKELPVKVYKAFKSLGGQSA